VIEVQEPCDITLGAHTYEFVKERWGAGVVDKQTYDERLLGSYIYDGCTFEENLRRRRIPRKTIRSGGWGKEEIIIGTFQTKFFSFTELSVNGRTEIPDTGFPKTAVVLKGEGKIKFSGGDMKIKQGDEIFLPFNVPDAKIEGNATVVLCHPEGVVY